MPAAAPLPSWPWKSALIPFAATVVLHLLMIPVNALILAIGVPGSVHDGVPGIHGEAPGGVDPADRNLLMELYTGIRIYTAEHGMTAEPLTPSVLEEIIQQNMPVNMADELRQRMDQEEVCWKGSFNGYRIGIRSGLRWRIINQRGMIVLRDDFF